MPDFRGPLICLFLLTASSTALAGVANQYQFDAADDYLAPADAFATWSSALERHQTQTQNKEGVFLLFLGDLDSDLVMTHA